MRFQIQLYIFYHGFQSPTFGNYESLCSFMYLQTSPEKKSCFVFLEEDFSERSSFKECAVSPDDGQHHLTHTCCSELTSVIPSGENKLCRLSLSDLRLLLIRCDRNSNITSCREREKSETSSGNTSRVGGSKVSVVEFTLNFVMFVHFVHAEKQMNVSQRTWRSSVSVPGFISPGLKATKSNYIQGCSEKMCSKFTWSANCRQEELRVQPTFYKPHMNYTTWYINQTIFTFWRKNRCRRDKFLIKKQQISTTKSIVNHLLTERWRSWTLNEFVFHILLLLSTCFGSFYTEVISRIQHHIRCFNLEHMKHLQVTEAGRYRACLSPTLWSGADPRQSPAVWPGFTWCFSF